MRDIFFTVIWKGPWYGESKFTICCRNGLIVTKLSSTVDLTDTRSPITTGSKTANGEVSVSGFGVIFMVVGTSAVAESEAGSGTAVNTTISGAGDCP